MVDVDWVRGLGRRLRELTGGGARILIVGGIGFVVPDGGTNLLQSPLHGWLKANTLATLAGMVVTYLGSRFWTFRHRERGDSTVREGALFVVLNGVGLAIQLACIGFANYTLGRSDTIASNIALFLGIVLGTLFRFWSYRKWVWTAPPGDKADSAEGAAGVAPREAAARSE
ncbi:MAG: GtrA family protein, partial [Streptosporangiales bacterium]|nr:GtrA family protein [Streptosporangiales bacterium]